MILKTILFDERNLSRMTEYYCSVLAASFRFCGPPSCVQSAQSQFRLPQEMFPTSPLKKRDAQKEKSKFTPQDEFTDLNPPITYRHLLSPNPGVRDPLRVIALCDSDAFYAACEQVRLGIDPSRPLVVRQWDALIAVNYPARAFGITRMSSWRDALKKCPELIVVHVATYKEGDNAPVYWDNPDTATHKVRPGFPWFYAQWAGVCGLTEYRRVGSPRRFYVSDWGF
jgi:hypothetical protein